MSKPKTITGQVLRTANNITNAFAAYNRTEIGRHEQNALEKLDRESGEFVRDVAGMSLKFGNPMASAINPLQRFRANIDPHAKFLKPSLNELYQKLCLTLDETQQRTVPRPTPGIIGLLTALDASETFENDDLSEMSSRYLSEEDLKLFYMDYSSGSKTDVAKERFETITDFRGAIIFAFSNMGLPKFIEKQNDAGYIISPLGTAALSVGRTCLSTRPEEPLC